MRVEDFAADRRAMVRRGEGGYLAFVPPPLPPTGDLDPDIVRRLSAADRAIGELSGVTAALGDWTVLTRPLVRREAVLSSRIEGTQASLSDLALFEIDVSANRDSIGDRREVFNYVRAIDHVLDPGRRLPLSLPLLLEAHSILMSGGRGAYATPGEFRRSQNWIGSPGSDLVGATFVPPAPEHLWDSLDAFEKYLHGERTLPPLLDIAAIHYQFEAMHPFIDGNGRVGRLLVTLLLVEWGLLPGPVLDLSAYIEPRRDRYYSALLRVSTHGDWVTWYAFMLEVFEHQAVKSVSRARALVSLRRTYGDRIRSGRSTSLLPRLVDDLFRVPAMTIPRAAKLLGVTHRAATSNVEKLVAAGILFEVAGPGRTRQFLAREIINVVQGDLR